MSSLSRAVREPPTPDVVARNTLAEVFEEEPVSLDVFVRDSQFLGNPPLSAVQYEAVRHIERIYYPTLYPLMAEEFDPYWAEPYRMCNFITLQWGKGSGKDHICRVASLRIAYLLLCLRSPQRYFGMPEQDTIHMLNIAASAPQAYQAFFAPITRVVRRGWFAHNCEPRQNLISYRKNVEVISGNSDAETQEGLNLMLGVADEIDAFRTSAELERYRGKTARPPTKTAEGILTMLRTSASTRFPETFKAVRISYPRFMGSTIQRLTAQAVKDNEDRGEQSRHYVSGPLLTWQVNPRFERFPLISIPETDKLVPDVASIVEDYQENPAMAKAMYECAPSRAIDAYFRNLDPFRASVDREDQPLSISYRPMWSTSAVTGRSVGPVWDPVYDFASDFQPIEGAVYAMHADLAVKHDRAGVSMSHVVRWEDVTVVATDEEGGQVEKVESRPVVRNDFTVSYTADASAQPQREIQIRWVRLLAFELIRRGFMIGRFTFDGFQSTDSMQILMSHGIEAERVSTDLSEDPWKTLRDVAYEGRLRLPYSELLFGELESLGRFNGKVDHPAGGSKDEADALACSIMGAVLVGGAEDPMAAVVYPSETAFEVGGLDGASLEDDGLGLDLFQYNAPREYEIHIPL